MSIKIVVNGANGNMGSLLCQHIIKTPEYDLIGKSTSEKELLGLLQQSPDIVVDLTRADVAYKNTKIIIDANIRPVIGTSGISQQEVQELQQICKQKQLGGIIAPNFSIGAMLMMKASEMAAKKFADIAIVEMHRLEKQDKPSGTALQTRYLLEKSRKNGSNPLTGESFNSLSDIPIHAIRIPGVIAKQQVIFGGNGETLTISHDSKDRECFMPGILFACRKVMQLDNLVYGLEKLLDF